MTTQDGSIRYGKEQVDGVSIFYREAGSPTAPAILLLHGFPSSSHMFRDLIPWLAPHAHVIAPDLPGHGTSGGDENADADRILAWLGALIDRTCEAKPTLVGQILGGAMAARFAIDHGDRLARLVLVDALGLCPFEPAPEFAGMLAVA